MSFSRKSFTSKPCRRTLSEMSVQLGSIERRDLGVGAGVGDFGRQLRLGGGDGREKRGLRGRPAGLRRQAAHHRTRRAARLVARVEALLDRLQLALDELGRLLAEDLLAL